jgi:xylulose-5-phosphate/fructose-6-phosphate phosphoketolase
MKRLFIQFSFPGGIPSHVAPETPGSIHEGGELAYALSHAFGAVFDNPDLIAACVIGDGEAETGALATSWHSNKFLNPVRDGAVLPILHLNGYKIASPTVLARIPHKELDQLLCGYGYPIMWKGTIRPACTSRWLLCSILSRRRSKQSSRRRVAKASPGGRVGRWSCYGRQRAGPVRGRLTANCAKGTGVRIRCRWATWTSRVM